MGIIFSKIYPACERALGAGRQHLPNRGGGVIFAGIGAMCNVAFAATDRRIRAL
jgi:hypothetical protein